MCAINNNNSPLLIQFIYRDAVFVFICDFVYPFSSPPNGVQLIFFLLIITTCSMLYLHLLIGSISVKCLTKLFYLQFLKILIFNFLKNTIFFLLFIQIHSPFFFSKKERKTFVASNSRLTGGHFTCRYFKRLSLHYDSLTIPRPLNLLNTHFK